MAMNDFLTLFLIRKINMEDIKEIISKYELFAMNYLNYDVEINFLRLARLLKKIDNINE